ncbi:hypothetical protein F4703DRAFT_1373435 [Phycomyces blakesleeanus]|uniref:RING-type E3 ubiquitin transferase n=1 Tax=Phycomyces blakesleeanus (strain ATCC 8743b / DSM 1359 / FGSC 10004 / NBRC 33097 / NRRL 1555) TaxID=763407 RepID=A0A162PTN4_PHYB8|nr:hypothetical protein PHYBLDRAFT_165865 [Phycomyces blakesleeanus NRRL 1555(-)]OAD75887.1 hypothetical protein PHYBLDRAFT_165865 [Phycomyces blakesleeanus NRRL 1555(-)]|eukprot:XP_018293927.1 hypothetical protein PHYBLDRAFT_165865 [Phycomyces blakesleeanus NRRL 1555(-)]
MVLSSSIRATEIPSTSPCPICLQVPDNQTYLKPCYHSFCFSCILKWINITPCCPLCKQLIDTLVYNVDEDKGTFQEYTLVGKDLDGQHNPPLKPPLITSEERLHAQRKEIYNSSIQIIHPKPLQRFANISILDPQHIQRARLFVRRELPILVGSLYEPMVEEYVESLLLIPYQKKASKRHDSSPVTMYEPSVLEPLSEWIGDLPGETRIAERFINELMGFVKSGMNYITFVSQSSRETFD